MNIKQDRQGVRRASDLEQKYSFGSVFKNQDSKNKEQSERLDAQNMSMTQFKSFATNKLDALQASLAALDGELDSLDNQIISINDAISDLRSNISSLGSTVAEAKTYTNTQVKKAAPRNLLDNSDFRNPVNQRGIASGSVTDWAYTLDRWEMGQIAYALVDEGLELTPNNENTEHIVFQYMDDALSKRLIGKAITFAVWLPDGSTYISSAVVPDAGSWKSILDHETDNVTLEICWDSSGTMIMTRILLKNKATISHIALYEGEYTTETLPEYQSKGYGAELAECQRYFYKVPYNAHFAYPGYIFNNTVTRCTIKLPMPMRITPTLSIGNVANLTVYGDAVYSVDSATVGAVQGDALSLILAGTFTKSGVAAAIKLNTVVTLSADL